MIFSCIHSINDSTASLLSFGISFLSLIVSIVVLVLTYQAWHLKVGKKVKGYWGYGSSIEAGGHYIGHVVLENCKDKDLVIHNMYLRFGRNIYLDLFAKDAVNNSYVHILPPLSTVVFNFGGALLYDDGSRIVDFDSLFRGKNRIDAKIVLNTNDGKIVVGNFRRGWSPTYQYFNNFATMLIRPISYYTDTSVYGKQGSVTLEHKAIDYTSYGKGTLFLVDLELEDNQVVTFPVFKDIKCYKFAELDFTDDNLKDSNSLRLFLEKSKKQNKIDFVSIKKITDLQKSREELLSQYTNSDTPLALETLNWWNYFIVSQIETWIYKFKEWKKRKNNQKKA